jgi:ABC-type dipeptide/oligopeptide/nickel transport system permease component
VIIIAAGFIIANVITDIAYTIIDPRIRLGGPSD